MGIEKKLTGFLLTSALTLMLTSVLLVTGCASSKSKTGEPVYYVSANGKNTYPGVKPGKPFRTIEAALTARSVENAKTIIVLGNIRGEINIIGSDREVVLIRGGPDGGAILGPNVQIDFDKNDKEAVKAAEKARKKAERKGIPWAPVSAPPVLSTESVITVDGNIHVRFENLEIRGGKVRGNGGGILVSGDASVTLGPGTIVRDNSAGSGGGVYFHSTGALILDGGTVMNNNGVSGGGIFFSDILGSGVSSRFVMHTGTVAQNTADMGGGILFLCATGRPGIFHIAGGSVRANYAGEGGGGIFFTGPDDNAGVLEFWGGDISGNTALNGGGLLLINGTLDYSGGRLVGNTATNDGAGLFYNSPMESRITAGVISGNRAGNFGGAVLLSQGKLSMIGGVVEQNTAKKGGGINVLRRGTFVKQGGTLYGSEGPFLGNIANFAEGQGDAAYKEAGTKYLRNTTVWPAQYLSTADESGWN
jgi:hypothetical protein